MDPGFPPFFASSPSLALRSASSSSRPSEARAGIVSNSGRCVLRSRVCSAPLRGSRRARNDAPQRIASSSSRPSEARAGTVSNSGRCVLRSRVCSAPLRGSRRARNDAPQRIASSSSRPSEARAGTVPNSGRCVFCAAAIRQNLVR